MRVIIITLFLFIVRAVAEDSDATIDPVNYTETYESSSFKKFVTHCSSHVAERCSESEAVQEEGAEKNGAYGLGLCLLDSMKTCLVEHGASLEQTTPTNQKHSSEDPQLFRPPPVNGVPVPLSPPIKSEDSKLFRPPPVNGVPVQLPPPIKSEDSKLFRPPPVNGVPVPLPPPIKFVASPPILDLIQPLPLSVETLKFQAVLRTCSHVSARTCFTHPNVAASTLSACLVPSLNQCVYPDDTSGDPPFLR